MSGFSTELKVGAFALVILAILAFMTFKVGGLQWTKSKGYVIYVDFNSTAGLDQKTKVKIAGVDAGLVEGIELVNGKARVKLSINRDIIIYRDASASIKSSGLLGDKFMAIMPGSAEQPRLMDGDAIESATEVVDFDELARKLMIVSSHFSVLADNLNGILGTQEAKNFLTQTLSNLSSITASLNHTIDTNDQRIKKVLDNVNEMTLSINRLLEDNRGPLTGAVADMRDFSRSLKTSAPGVMEDLGRTAKELRAVLEENRTGVRNTVESLDSITRRIDNGEGTLGKIVKDDKLYESVNKAVEGVNRTISAVDRFRTFISFQADYLAKSKDGKGSFYVTLQPRPDKYYILGVVGDPVAVVTSKETVVSAPSGTYTVTQDDIQKKIEFTAQFAKRVGDAAVRIGLTESTFGAGADYFFNNDKGKVSADIWDISKNEENAQNPHVTVGIDYFVFKHLFLRAGADNILNKKWRGGYVGAGMRFEDEDFKYLLGTLSKIPAN